MGSAIKQTIVKKRTKKFRRFQQASLNKTKGRRRGLACCIGMVLDVRERGARPRWVLDVPSGWRDALVEEGGQTGEDSRGRLYGGSCEESVVRY